MSYPDNNPKTAVGATKVPLHLVPPVASHYMALAFKDGAAKYGPYNWREHTVSGSVYYGAIRRHLDAWWDGEDVSRDALVHHLGHVMACCAILLDAMSVGKLNDDRPLKGASADLQAGFPEGGVLGARLGDACAEVARRVIDRELIDVTRIEDAEPRYVAGSGRAV